MGLLAPLGAAAQEVRLWPSPQPSSTSPDPSLRSPSPGASQLPAVTLDAIVALPLLNGASTRGVVWRTDASGAAQEVSGVLTGADQGTFAVATSATGDIAGQVLLPDRRVAYILSGSAARPTMVERPLSEVICERLPRPDRPQNARATAPRSAAAPPFLNSRPASVAVLYIDFDGATVTDSHWNGGRTIVAAAAGLSVAGMTEVWRRVTEDYLPFNINVTTDPAVYANAPVGQRSRCIVTPTSEWYGDGTAGGVASIDSFSEAGTGGLSATIPCWAFITNDVKDCAEVISHEFGHTLGLYHDGRTSPSETYYLGHGSGALGWAPIMGAGYYREVTQWSQGEYPSANNGQDDLAIITSPINGFGYAPADAGNSLATAQFIDAPDGNLSQRGVIGSTGEADYYMLTVDRAGEFQVSATPASIGGNLAISIRLLSEAGDLVQASATGSSLAATLTTTVAPGTFYLVVQGRSRAALGSDYGFTTYASIGAYNLTGSPIGPRPVVVVPRNYQPDIAVGKGAKRVGSAEFGKVAQRYSAAFKGSRPLRIPLTLKNLGIKTDSLFVTSIGTLSGHKYRILLKNKDVTDDIRSGNYYSGTLGSSQSETLTLEIRPNPAIRASRKITIKAVSLADETKNDTITVDVRQKRKPRR